MEEEIWKDVKGYEGLYQASNLGRVKSLSNKFSRKEKILKLHPRSNGRLSCTTCKNGVRSTKYVHKLVAIAFLNHIPSGLNFVVDHIDGDYLNNNVLNLRVVTHRENISVCFRKDRETLTSKYPGVSKCSSAKKWSSNIAINGKGIYLGSFDTELEASEVYLNALIHIKNGTLDIYRKSIKHKFTSTYKGVCWYKNSGKWKAGLTLNGKSINLGYFDTEIEASEAYQNALKLYVV